ncbi:hypothetical protein HJC99_03645 [Candidatus Saccharibacteria bacterium]|nr:hypothetical protein [Candidatus Saccharibacteria bacterium]
MTENTNETANTPFPVFGAYEMADLVQEYMMSLGAPVSIRAAVLAFLEDKYPVSAVDDYSLWVERFRMITRFGPKDSIYEWLRVFGLDCVDQFDRLANFIRASVAAVVEFVLLHDGYYGEARRLDAVCQLSPVTSELATSHPH